MNKYKLIIFGDYWDVYLTSYKELIDDPYITYISTFRPKGLLGQLQRIQFNPKLNHVLSIPGKNLWNPYYLRKEKGKDFCFLILEKWLRHESAIQLLPYLRKHYPESKIVCFFQDLIDTIKDRYTDKVVDINYVKRYSDLIISYDKSDAQKHHTAYHPTIYSPLNIQSTSTKYDLYFLGRDKGRMDMLIRLCQEAQKRGLRCKFDMIEIPRQKQISQEGMNYPNGEISYAENLRNSSESRCIIEMLQQDASSPTLRTWEAIALNRKLLTNNSSIKETEFHDSRYISVFHDETDIDWDFIKNDNAFPTANPFMEQIRPIRLVEFMEKQLNIQINHQ